MTAPRQRLIAHRKVNALSELPVDLRTRTLGNARHARIKISVLAPTARLLIGQHARVVIGLKVIVRRVHQRLAENRFGTRRLHRVQRAAVMALVLAVLGHPVWPPMRRRLHPRSSAQHDKRRDRARSIWIGAPTMTTIPAAKPPMHRPIRRSAA